MDLPPCAENIATHYEVPLTLIGAVRAAEGGYLGAKIGPNKNGSYDLGPMQINTNWLNGTFDVNLTDYGITEQQLLENECQNIAVGAWVLRMEYDRTRSWVEAVGAYNAGYKNRNGSVAKTYRERVFRWWDRIKAKQGVGDAQALGIETDGPRAIVVRASNTGAGR